METSASVCQVRCCAFTRRRRIHPDGRVQLLRGLRTYGDLPARGRQRLGRARDPRNSAASAVVANGVKVTIDTDAWDDPELDLKKAKSSFTVRT